MVKVLVKKLGENLNLGLGAITTGILGTEPILSTDKLAKDLWFAKKLNIKTVTIFRLGGLTPEYIEVLEKYIS